MEAIEIFFPDAAVVCVAVTMMLLLLLPTPLLTLPTITPTIAPQITQALTL